MNIVKEIENFITDEQSNELIDMGEKTFYKMTVMGKNPRADYRTADGTWLSNQNPLSKLVREKISQVVGLPTENMEGTHIVKYGVGGEYKVHHDFFHTNTDYYERSISRGGQRKFTALIYLNDDFKGGETEFPKLNIKVQPQKNKLVIWDNLKENGELNYDSLHAGLPVIEGTKYICIIWIREKQFI
jgi:prolyl 4-hydroxylase